MATAAQRRRYWAYRKNMQARGKRNQILSLEEWLETPKDQLVRQPEKEPKAQKLPAPKKARSKKNKGGIKPKIEE